MLHSFVKRDRVTTTGYVCRFAFKATLIGGIVYYSVQQGLWSKSEDSVQLYGRIYNNVAPYVKDNIPKEVINEVGFISSSKQFLMVFSAYFLHI
jgi:hypothetical protein